MSEERTGIIIFGARGFIGLNLCEKLLKMKTCEIFAVDSDEFSDPKCIQHFKIKNSSFLKGRYHEFVFDINNRFEVANFYDKLKNKNNVKIIEIYNLACPASPPKYQKNPLHTIQTNTIGLMNILDGMKEWYPSAKFLQSSTSEVYGEPKESPQSEDYFGNVNTVGPRSCYDEGKRVAESICREYFEKQKLDIRIVRIFNTYGPYMSRTDGRVITNFIHASLTDTPLTIITANNKKDNMYPYRSFCYIDDLLEMICESVMFMSSSREMILVNTGNDQDFCDISELSIKVFKIRDKLLQLINPTYKVILCDPRKDDPSTRKPNMIKFKNMFCHVPDFTSLDEGLLKTFQFYMECYK